MKLMIQIDSMPHWIDTVDPELLAKWIVEIFGRLPEITPATLIEVRAQPSFLYQRATGQWVPDWETDSAIIGFIRRVRSPRELLDELSRQLDVAEALEP